MRQNLDRDKLLDLVLPKGGRCAAAAALLLLLGSVLPAPDLRAATIHSFAASKGAAPQALVTARGGEVYGITAGGGSHGRGTVFRMGPAGVPEVLHAFTGGADGMTPTALIEGKNGALYGATAAYVQQAVDGSIFYTAGTLFVIKDRGALVTLTRAFSVPPHTTYPNNQGGPVALARGVDEALYGVTDNDGMGYGTLFRLDRNGVLSILHTFSGIGDGAQPNTLILGGDGNFYGTTAQGASGNGTVFRLAADGKFTTLAALPALAGASATPSSLLWAEDGNLYAGLLASTSSPGVPGAVLRVTPAGLVMLLQRVGNSATARGQGPRALLQSADGSFYGTTFGDGAYGAGTLFRLTPAGSLTTLHVFTGKADGEAPNALTHTLRRRQMLYGTTSGNIDPTSGIGSYASSGDFGTVYRWRVGEGFETLHRFRYEHDFNPNSLLRTRSGLLYGTTAGDITAPDADAGTVFVTTPRGELRTLYRFTGGADGGNPTSITEASDGNFYGRTSVGGGSGNQGTLFRMTPRGELTTLHAFTGNFGGEGSALVEAPDGNFYGTSQNGLALVFRLTPDGAFSVLAVFPVVGMFAPSIGSLLVGNDGSLYGTTLGITGPGLGFDIPGTVFRLTLAGKITTLAQLEVEPVLQFQGRDGRFYGTTSGSLFQFSGQAAGTVFAMTQQGQISTLFDFGDGASGVWPNLLIETQDGTLFGTTLGIDSQFSVSADYGSVFRLTQEGALNTLLRFDPEYAADGSVLLSQPTALVEGSRGAIYGTTLNGGAASAGSVFKLEEDRTGAMVSIEPSQ